MGHEPYRALQLTRKGGAPLKANVEAAEKVRSRSTQQLGTTRAAIRRLDINDRLHCDLTAERIVEHRSGSIREHQQNRGCFGGSSIIGVSGPFLHLRLTAGAQ
jgi:hypothetical protein